MVAHSRVISSPPLRHLPLPKHSTPVTLALSPLCVVCAQMLALLFMAFVVAGFVEELFKFLIVRFCNLGAPLRNPHTILIYLVRYPFSSKLRKKRYKGYVFTCI